jgi:hypothetical protein
MLVIFVWCIGNEKENRKWNKHFSLLTSFFFP